MSPANYPLSNNNHKWIRGVNLGGWLLIERYIVPYQFAITNCHLQGDFCWYPGALSAPPTDSPDYKLCNLDECKPVLSTNVFGAQDYPIDEWHLSEAFSDKDIAEQWLNYHFEHFLKKEHLVKLKNAGITHVRVPLPHWILGDIRDNEPWIAGDRWKYFKRMCEWAREIGLEVWPNIHTAPGSQNGFDNSGIQNTVKTCGGWSDADPNIEKSLDVLHEVANQIKRDGLDDVITGFGLLNEPFGDCSKLKYRMFLDNGFDILRSTLPNISLYVADLFQADLFNDGQWWLDSKHQGTYLDSHYYNIFDPFSRSMSPQEHIEEVCHPESGKRIDDCCFIDGPQDNTTVSDGVGRVVTEWSAAFDCMPGNLLSQVIMPGIQENGMAPLFDRQLSPERQDFLRKFMQAQIVEYEKADMPGLSAGWFFWTLQTEGGAYIEWDFLRGLKDGWVPTIAPPHVSSQSLYGTCQEIQAQTNETMEVVHAYPWGDEAYWGGASTGKESPSSNESKEKMHLSPLNWLLILLIAIVAIAWKLCRSIKHCSRKRREYSSVDNVEILPT